MIQMSMSTLYQMHAQSEIPEFTWHVVVGGKTFPGVPITQSLERSALRMHMSFSVAIQVVSFLR